MWWNPTVCCHANEKEQNDGEPNVFNVLMMAAMSLSLINSKDFQHTENKNVIYLLLYKSAFPTKPSLLQYLM